MEAVPQFELMIGQACWRLFRDRGEEERGAGKELHKIRMYLAQIIRKGHKRSHLDFP